MTSGEYITGIVLAKKDRKEFDTVISFYSQEYGKVEILVRSARKITSKLAPLVSEPFALVKLKVVRGKRYYHLIGGEAQERFKNIYTDYLKMSRIAHVFNSINAIVKFKKPDAKVFSLLITFLKKANTIPQEKITILIPAFLIKFLSFLGYRPEIRACVVCQSPLPTSDVQGDVGGLYFDFEKGGIICKKHKGDDENREEINAFVLTILQQLLYKEFDFVIDQKFNNKNIQTVRQIINTFYQWHLAP